MLAPKSLQHSKPNPRRLPQRKCPVTVCIGVISSPLVIVASDRMITSDDIQFEQQQPKIFNLARNTLALISGDIATQTALVNATRVAVKKTGVKTVEDVARLFADAYGGYCRRKAEAEVLAPLGVASVDELLTKKKWPVNVVDELLRQLQHAAFNDDVATIIAGQDESGPHLYVVDQPGKYSVRDGIGFASVGIGQRHAESQFMFAGYTPWWPFPKALYLTYVAKKRAEVAPGVGKHTDLAVITSGEKADIVPLDQGFTPDLDRIYSAETKAINETLRPAAYEELETAIKRLLNIPALPPLPTNPAVNPPTAPPPDPSTGPIPPDSTRDPKDPPPSPV
jgi:20S proteasome alpha/beta subunit